VNELIDWDMIHIKIIKLKNNLFSASFYKDSDFRAGKEEGSCTFKDEGSFQEKKENIIKAVKNYLRENL